jgi:hypothetical protein
MKALFDIVFCCYCFLVLKETIKKINTLAVIQLKIIQMTFIIKNVELIPPTEYDGYYDWSDFKYIPTEEVPEEIVDKIKNYVANDKFGLPYDPKSGQFKYQNKVYQAGTRMCPVGLKEEEKIAYYLKNLKIEVAHSKTTEIMGIYNSFKPFLDEIISKIGTEVRLRDLPITNTFYDFSKPHWCFGLRKDTLLLTIKGKGPNLGSAGGPTTITLATIARIYISSTEGKEITKICDKCGSILCN